LEIKRNQKPKWASSGEGVDCFLCLVIRFPKKLSAM
jgi:hypothetical protein